MGTRRSRGELVVAILDLIEQRGRATRADIHTSLGITQGSCGQMMSRLNKDSPRAGKRIYVIDWTWEHPGKRTYPRAVYARCVTGRERDMTLGQAVARKKQIHAQSSVFGWADSLAKPKRKPSKNQRAKLAQRFTKKD